MSKERPQYIHDSDAEPSSLTPAQEAFFRYQYTLGSYEYTRRHGPAEEAGALSAELDQRYDEYRVLRDYPEDLYAAAGPLASADSGHQLFLCERPFFERLDQLRAVQEALERQGYYFHPVEREHTDGLVTDPLLSRLRNQIKKRGFSKLAAHVAITFTGYAQDEREIWQIPEVRAYWRKLDGQLPELPALLAHLPQFQFNGPGQHLLLTSEPSELTAHRTLGGYDVSVADAPGKITQAKWRIQQAGAKYHLSSQTVRNLMAHFEQAATGRRAESPAERGV